MCLGTLAVGCHGNIYTETIQLYGTKQQNADNGLIYASSTLWMESTCR